mgnify:CR=1 FL=1
MNTYNVATSGNDKFEQLVKVHVESASGIGADYLIKLINYPSTTITASPVFADASLSSVVLMTDGRLYTSGQAGIYATGQGPNSKFGVVGNVLAGDSGEEGTYLEDIINAAVTADERTGSIKCMQSSQTVVFGLGEIIHTINLATVQIKMSRLCKSWCILPDNESISIFIKGKWRKCNNSGTVS